MSNEEKYKWDFFLSHSLLDKEEVARPLSDLLKNRGKKVWLDENEISAGDSISIKIAHGLEQSTYGIVIFSQTFFEGKWSKKELETLVALESNDQKRIIPVWHEVDYSFVEGKSRILADRLAPRTSDGLKNVSNQILRATFKDPINISNIEEVLDEVFPPQNKRGKHENDSKGRQDFYSKRCEDYGYLMKIMDKYDITEMVHFKEILYEQLPKVFKYEEESVQASLNQYSDYALNPDYRLSRGVFHGHVKLAEMAIKWHFENDGE